MKPEVAQKIWKIVNNALSNYRKQFSENDHEFFQAFQGEFDIFW